jgi:hypothetical protein
MTSSFYDFVKKIDIEEYNKKWKSIPQNILDKFDELLVPIIEELKQPWKLEETYTQLHQEDPASAENFRLSLRSVVTGNANFSDSEFVRRIDNLRPNIQWWLWTNSMDNVRAIDGWFAKAENWLDVKAKGKDRFIALADVPNTCDVPIWSTEEEDRKINEISKEYDEKIEPLEKELNTTKWIIGILESAINIYQTQKIEDEKTFVEEVKTVIIEYISNSKLAFENDLLSKYNFGWITNVNDLKDLKNSLDWFFAEKEKEYQRLVDEKERELKKANDEIYRNKKELKEKQKEGLKAFHNLFLDRFWTEFLQKFINLININPWRYGVSRIEIKDWKFWIESVSWNLSADLFKNLLKVVSVGFFWNEKDIHLEQDGQNPFKANLKKDWQTIIDDFKIEQEIRNNLKGNSNEKNFKDSKDMFYNFWRNLENYNPQSDAKNSGGG